MRLAFAEIRRTRGRFLSITAAIGFIIFLVLILAGLADGLYYGATGAYRNGNADLYVFDQDAQRSAVRSELPASTPEAVREVPGVTDAGGVGIQLGSATVGGERIDVALIGTEPGRPGAPVDLSSYPVGGDPIAVADESLKAAGVEIGDLIVMTGATTGVRIVDFVDDSAFLLAGTLWTDIPSWSTIRTEIVPELAFRGDVVDSVAVATEAGVEPAVVAADIDVALGFTETVTTSQAISALPAVDQQRSTFNAIIGTSFLVVGIVTALFFALITLEKRGLIAVLKAIGSTNRSLLGGVILQGLIAGVGGFALGFALSRLIGAVIPPEVPLTFLTGTAQSLLIATLVMGTLGAALSFRRISKIDPATALGGGT